MIGESRILTMLRGAIAQSRADQTEAIFIGGYAGLTRYANSYIHQNVAETNTMVVFRTAANGKIGVASTNSLSKENLARALNNSLEVGRHQPKNPDFAGMPGTAKYKKINTYFEPTAAFTPKQRAEVIRKICREADKFRLTVAGAFSTSASEVAVVNSNGLVAYQPFTTASINLVAMSDNSSGYGAGLSRRVLKIPFSAITERAIKKCIEGKNPAELEPGKHDVILEPEAVSEVMDWMMFIAFGAKSYHEKTSFLSGKVGKKVMSPEINIFDNGFDTSGLAMPFDFEGVPKKKTYFVKNGLGAGPVYDSIYAAKYKTRSTGHALPPGSGEGPVPSNIFIAPGKKSRASLIAAVKDGILVTRFHYINGLLNTTRALMTGMTRDGTFRIKNGRIVGPVKNLRFTESITAAFSRIGGVSRETRLVKNWWGDFGCCSSPTLWIKKFNFSGKTDF